MARTDVEEGEAQRDDGDCDLLDLSEDLPVQLAGSILTPPEVSNRSIGSTRRSSSRSRHRHHRRRSRCRFKRKESNFVAAICSMVVLVLMCTALAEPQWFYMRGGGCKDHKHDEMNYIGVNQFFYMGTFVQDQDPWIKTAYKFGPKPDDVMYNCVTVNVTSIMKSIISLSFFGITLSLAAFLLDLSGPTHKLLKIIRRHGILNILTVGFCVVINGFCYWATEDLAVFQKETRLKPGSKIRIEFSISFFLITAAGAASVVAAACNLLRRHGSASSSSSSSTTRDQEIDDQEHLLGSYEGREFDPSDMNQSLSCLPPPPPYSP